MGRVCTGGHGALAGARIVSIVDIEAAIVARLDLLVRDGAGLVEQVYTHGDYADIPEGNMVTPSLAVIYAGYEPTANPGNAAHIQLIAFNFTVVINVASALQSDRGDGVRAEASPIFDATLEALLGFRPLPKFKPLQLKPAPGAAISETGFGYYPLAFSTSAQYMGRTS